MFEGGGFVGVGTAVDADELVDDDDGLELAHRVEEVNGEDAEFTDGDCHIDEVRLGRLLFQVVDEEGEEAGAAEGNQHYCGHVKAEHVELLVDPLFVQVLVYVVQDGNQQQKVN